MRRSGIFKPVLRRFDGRHGHNALAAVERYNGVLGAGAVEVAALVYIATPPWRTGREGWSHGVVEDCDRGVAPSVILKDASGAGIHGARDPEASVDKAPIAPNAHTIHETGLQPDARRALGSVLTKDSDAGRAERNSISANSVAGGRTGNADNAIGVACIATGVAFDSPGIARGRACDSNESIRCLYLWRCSAR